MIKRIKNKGFTIIELLVVVLIIGVIASISLPVFLNAVEKSRTSEPLQTLSAIAKAEQRYKLQDNVYSDQIDSLDITLKDYSSGTDASGSEFDSEFFNYTLASGSASAVRKGEESSVYTLGVDYTTNQLSCTPVEHKICLALGLGEGIPAEPESPAPICHTEEYYGQVVYSCDYGNYRIDQEKWCNGNVPIYVNYWDPTQTILSSGCVDGETKWEDGMWSTTLKKCHTSSGSSEECLPNSYFNTILEISRPPDDVLRSANRFGHDAPIMTEISCETDPTDGSCIRYTSIYEMSEASPGGCVRGCFEIDSTGFDCQTWGSWDCD